MCVSEASLAKSVLSQRSFQHFSLSLSNANTCSRTLIHTPSHTHARTRTYTHTHTHTHAQTHTLASYTRSHAHALSFISLKRLHTLPYSITHTQKKVCLSLHLCFCLGGGSRKKLYKFIPALSLWGNKGGTVKASEQIYFLLKWK